MENLMTLEANPRETTGKIPTRKLRKNGLIPANLIVGGKSRSISLNPKWLGRIYKDFSGKFILDLENEKKHVFIKEVHVHPTKRVPLHVDLMLSEG